MIHIAICDNNPYDLNYYQNHITSLSAKHRILTEITTYTDAENLLFELEDKLHTIDLFYLDIELEKTNGIALAKILREQGSLAQIIYISCSKDYVFDIFDTNPKYYFVKNTLDLCKFEEVFLSCVTLIMKKQHDYFLLKNGGQLIRLDQSQIIYFEVIKRILHIYYETGETYKYYEQLQSLLDTLPKNRFVQIHRSFLINIEHVQFIDKNIVTLTNGTQLPVGRKFMSSLHLLFHHYLYHPDIHSS